MTMSLVQQVEVFRVPCGGPGDLSGVQALIDSHALVPADIVAVMGKTEGNGCVNDHTRDFAATNWCHFLAPHLDCSPQRVAQRVALVMSGGTEGVLSPQEQRIVSASGNSTASYGLRRQTWITRFAAPTNCAAFARCSAFRCALRVARMRTSLFCAISSAR